MAPEFSVVPVAEHVGTSHTAVAIYISYVRIRGFLHESGHIIYTTVVPEAGDVLIPLLATVLIVRNSAAGWNIADVGYGQSASDVLMPLPSDWLSHRIPDISYSIVSSCQPAPPDDTYDCSHLACDLELNGPAIAELLGNELLSSPGKPLDVAKWDVGAFVLEHDIWVDQDCL
ncbi:hypothetical protein CLCR_10904 [Cladophialophora carrionii]|uniref:Uncharacterized protein n=1 Tax=Cladophialophora carrionii TaxID=86049 RepID=A0A1C1CYV3_9EURO|nr:hypothetical protein CLCR_10904 [Cladophialophora carrionii]